MVLVLDGTRCEIPPCVYPVPWYATIPTTLIYSLARVISFCVIFDGMFCALANFRLFLPSIIIVEWPHTLSHRMGEWVRIPDKVCCTLTATQIQSV